MSATLFLVNSPFSALGRRNDTSGYLCAHTVTLYINKIREETLWNFPLEHSLKVLCNCKQAAVFQYAPRIAMIYHQRDLITAPAPERKRLLTLPEEEVYLCSVMYWLSAIPSWKIIFY